jgi:hypothetical protein
VPSAALGRPRPRRTKQPERWGIEINEQNRPVLADILEMLWRCSDRYRADPAKHRQLRLINQSITLLTSLLDTNARQIVIDPDDFVERSVMLFLDETCLGLILRYRNQLRYAAGDDAYYAYHQV